MNKIKWIDDIICPYCSGSLKVVENIINKDSKGFSGIVECACRLHPVTHNILNFGGKTCYAMDTAVSYLKKGNIEKATLVQIENETLGQTFFSKIVKKLFKYGVIHKEKVSSWRNLTAPDLLHVSTFTQGIKRLNLGSFGEYLIHRYALPSFHAALPICFLLRTLNFQSILDVGCGAGHYTYILKKLFPDSAYFGIDQYYANLLLGQRFLTPGDGIFVCLDLKHKAPFKKKFGLVFSSDTHHTLSIESFFLKNYLDFVETSGLIYLPRFDHSWGKSFRHKPSERYKPDNGMVCYYLSEEFIIETLHRENRIALGKVLEQQELNNSRALGLILGNPRDIINLESDNFFEKLSQTIGPWCLNPCYRQIPDKEKNIFHLDTNCALPHPEERKNTILNYMPAELELPHGSVESRQILQNIELLPQMIRNYSVHVSPPDYWEK